MRKKSLLILDEAHNVAPASANQYAIDSRTTHLARDLATHFENRLFLSATPHNGHSNSFSALLEILDPQRFTRGVPISPKRLAPIMVRRLKDDLRQLGSRDYPERKVVQVELVQGDGSWTARTIAFGRLSLFGPGATRLHDQLVRVASPWLESGGPKHLQPYDDRADRKAASLLEEALGRTPTLDRAPEKIRKRLLDAATADFKALWPHVKNEAEEHVLDAERKLAARAATESDALRKILEEQRAAIRETIKGHDQQAILFQFTEVEKLEQEQFEQDKKHMARRLEAIDKELETEPTQIAALYRIVLRRLEPVGLVYLWPETRS